MPTLLVISPTASNEQAELMVRTARRVGIEPMLYGQSCRHPHGKDYQGTEIVRILTERTDAEYVMGVDAYDVAWLTGEEETLDKFKRFEHPFVMSCERTGVGGLVKTKNRLTKMCYEVGGTLPQPNIGGWIGERKYALHCFNEAQRLYEHNPEDPNYNYDNHYQWLAMMKAWGGAEFDLDWFSVIFQSMDGANYSWVIPNRRISNMDTLTWPSVAHFHGDPTRVAYREMCARLLG